MAPFRCISGAFWIYCARSHDDPSIGSAQALRGGTLRESIDQYPLTFRLMGPNSNDAFAGWNRLFTMGYGLVERHPVTDRFTATYYLPEAGETTLRLTDATGRVLQTVQTNRERGYNETEFDINGNEPGMLFLRLDGPGGSDLQKVMKF